MMKKRSCKDEYIVDLERKIIKISKNILDSDLSLKQGWKLIESELEYCLKKNATYKIHFDNFFNFPHIKIVKSVEYLGVRFPQKESPHVWRLEGEIQRVCYWALDEQSLKILYLERKDKFLLVPEKTGKFVEESEIHDSREDVDGVSFVKKENNRGNLLPVIKSKAIHEYDELVEEIKNRYIPSVAIIDDKYFLICVSSESSMKNLFEYRQELSEIFHKHFRNKVGRPQTKEFYQSEFNFRFEILRAGRWSIDKCCKKIAEEFKQDLGYDVTPETLKRNYYQEYKKNPSKTHFLLPEPRE